MIQTIGGAQYSAYGRELASRQHDESSPNAHEDTFMRIILSDKTTSDEKDIALLGQDMGRGTINRRDDTMKFQVQQLAACAIAGAVPGNIGQILAGIGLDASHHVTTRNDLHGIGKKAIVAIMESPNTTPEQRAIATSAYKKGEQGFHPGPWFAARVEGLELIAGRPARAI